MKKVVVVTAIVLSAGVAAWAAGTALTLAFSTPTVACPGGNVSAPYTISTTAANGAAVTETLTDSGGATVGIHSYTIAAGDVTTGGGWTFAGRTKTRDGIFTYSGLLDGTYTLEVCAVQAGSSGNPSKSICQTETILVNCGQQVTACTAAPFGETPANLHIRDHATAQLQFHGDFGDPATVRITGPNGSSAFDSDNVSIGENGNSCNYHANWSFTGNGNGSDLTGNGGPGSYHVVVTGNGRQLLYDVTLND